MVLQRNSLIFWVKLSDFFHTDRCVLLHNLLTCGRQWSIGPAPCCSTDWGDRSRQTAAPCDPTERRTSLSCWDTTETHPAPVCQSPTSLQRDIMYRYISITKMLNMAGVVINNRYVLLFIENSYCGSNAELLYLSMLMLLTLKHQD